MTSKLIRASLPPGASEGKLKLICCIHCAKRIRLADTFVHSDAHKRYNPSQEETSFKKVFARHSSH